MCEYRISLLTPFPSACASIFAPAHHYLKSGWLARLGRGVFMFPNDTLRRDDCLKFLSRRVKGFHVGGKTALAWRGVRHNLPAREPLSLWGEGKSRFA